MFLQYKSTFETVSTVKKFKPSKKNFSVRDN